MSDENLPRRKSRADALRQQRDRIARVMMRKALCVWANPDDSEQIARAIYQYVGVKPGTEKYTFTFGDRRLVVVESTAIEANYAIVLDEDGIFSWAQFEHCLREAHQEWQRLNPGGA